MNVAALVTALTMGVLTTLKFAKAPAGVVGTVGVALPLGFKTAIANGVPAAEKYPVVPTVICTIMVVLLTTLTTSPVPVTIWVPLAKTAVTWFVPLGTKPAPLMTKLTTSVPVVSTGVAAGNRLVIVATGGVTVTCSGNAMVVPS